MSHKEKCYCRECMPGKNTHNKQCNCKKCIAKKQERKKSLFKVSRGKKAQLGDFAINWLIAMILVFGMISFTMLWYKPWQTIDNSLSPKIDASYCAGGKCATDIPAQARRNQVVIPVILIGGVILMAFLASLKRDPNVPYE